MLSAATAAIRTNWLQAIRQAAAASNALAVAPVSSVGTHGLTLATVSSIGSSTASIASGLTSSSSPSSAGGSPGSAMLSGHSDNSRQFRRQLSPARTTTTTTSGPITSPVTTTESITHCTKEMTLPLGQEKVIYVFISTISWTYRILKKFSYLRYIKKRTINFYLHKCHKKLTSAKLIIVLVIINVLFFRLPLRRD